MNSPTDILKEARLRAVARGVIASSYEDRFGCCCLLGYVAQAELGVGAVRSHPGVISRSRKAPAWNYVIAACKELLPGWDHKSISDSWARMRIIPTYSWENYLPEAVITIVLTQGGDDIPNIIYTRAIKLAEADEKVDNDRVADEAEVLANSRTMIDTFAGEVITV